MTDWETTLQRSLIDRAGALGAYIRALQARSARSDDGFWLALDMCHRYTDAVQLEIDYSMQAQRDAQGRRDKVSSLAREFFEKEKWIDQRFARGAQGDVPRALKTMARREFKRHGLNNQEPVLTVGAPDNFEAHKPNLARFLFRRLLYLDNYREQLSEVPVERQLSIISVPYIEGTRTLWYPITLGHEIGHMRLESEGQESIVALTQDWFDDADAARIGGARRSIAQQDGDQAQAADPEDGAPVDDRARDLLGPARSSRETLENWVEEILCDLNAVRLFGPAGLNAIAEFLAALPSSNDPTTRWLSHPPLRLRIQVMLEFLRQTGQSDSFGLTDAWKSYLAADARLLPPEETFVAKCFEDPINLERLIAHALSWGEPYLATRHATTIEWVTNELLDGVPGGTHCPNAPEGDDLVSAADAANAAWIARNALEERESDRRSGVLLEADEISMPRKRLLVDRLASKAIDSIEFARLWRSTAAPVENVRHLKPTSKRPKGPTGGILSRSAIIRRLRASGSKRLLVTPLLTDSIQDAGIDLRLGPDFIVFRHSATGAFDALDKQQDPRMLQEAVEKGWGVPFILHPGELVLAATLEYVVIPEDVAAQVVTRSSYGRLGLITATAVQVQPGSRGCVTLELVNHGDTPIALTPGARIGQLVFFALEEPGPAAPGKYRFPVGPEFSQVAADRDAETLELIKRAAQSSLDSAERYGSESRLPRMEFEAVLPSYDGAHFEEIAEREGLETSIVRTGLDDARSVADLLELVNRGTGIGTLTVTGSGTYDNFCRATLRYCLSYGRRLEMEIDFDGVVHVCHMTQEKECDIFVSLPHYDEKGQRTKGDPEFQLVMADTLDDHRRLGRALTFLASKRQPGRRPDDWAEETGAAARQHA